MVSIVGYAHSFFGKLENDNVESLLGSIITDVLNNTGVDAADIDAIYLGHFNGGFEPQEFTSSIVLQQHPKLRFKPVVRVENACATGSAAVHLGVKNVLAQKAVGKKSLTLVVGVEKMTHLSSREIGDILLKASYLKEEGDIKGGFAGVFGRICSTYFDAFGDQSLALAHIAAKNHKNGCTNPFAQMKRDFGVEFCHEISEKNPVVAPPLRRTDCSLISDGAAAILLADDETAKSFDKRVKFKSVAHINDFMPMSKRDMTQLEGAKKAWESALSSANLSSIYDLDFVETHDCFTIAELMQYEAMGITAAGDGFKAAIEGWTAADGKLPVNRSGGLKAKGHPIGATGISMHAITAMQLLGDAGDMQLSGDLKCGGIFNMGGSGVANYVSILEAE